ncbi:MAG: Coenzyme F420 hydrogenase/dehydrogenase, beta subunit C-terminal domain [Candidatus Bathyarchaeia archaeon]
MAARPKVFATLLAEVVRRGNCMFCGACMATCPTFALLPTGEEPALKGQCIACQLCYHHCPRTPDALPYPFEAVEKAVFGEVRSREDPGRLIGVYKGVYAARSTKEDILKVCQDGGAVTSLLAYGLESKAFDAAVTAGRLDDTPWKAMPAVALSYQGLLKTAGTKYTASPTLLGLMSAVQEYYKRNVAVVGTPCQVQALRRMQTHSFGVSKLTKAVKLTVGLFCMESYSYDGLMKHLQSAGFDPSAITRFDIKKGVFTASTTGQNSYSSKLDQLDHLVKNSCRICTDFTAELADISVGAVGAPLGWSFVITRSQLGEQILLDAERAGFLTLKTGEELKPGLGPVLKLAERKRARGQPAQVLDLKTAARPA